MDILAILLGVATGTIIGLTGGGGAVIAVPALVYGLHLSLSAAVPTSLVIVAASSLVALIPRIRAHIDWTVVICAGGAGMVTALLGAWAHDFFPERPLMILFAGLMLLSAIRLFMPQPIIEYDPAGRRLRDVAPKALITGVIVGFLTGLLGVGGGFLIVPALVIIMRLPMSVVVGTSQAIVTLNALAGIVGYIPALPSLPWNLVLSYAIAAMIASFIAGRFGRKLPDAWVRIGFAVLVVLLACVVLVENLLPLLQGK